MKTDERRALPGKMKILVTRTDRLGDTILASPTWQALKKDLPNASITLLTGSALTGLFRDDPDLSNVLGMPADNGTGMAELAAALNAAQFDAVIALYVNRPLAGLLRKVKAPIKIGPLSKPSSWFLFNRSVRQRRSRSLMHEADYNGRLLEQLGLRYTPRPPRLYLSSRLAEKEHLLLERLMGAKAGEAPIVVHPGMGGSARNWPAEKYRDLVERLLTERSEPVVVTGTAGDRQWLEPIEDIRDQRLINASGRLDLIELALLLRRARLFVGPSTGPMHLATALSTPVVALFSPIAVQQPLRWGPYHSAGTVIVPQVRCPRKRRCPLASCPHFDCMDTVRVDEVFAAIETHL